MHHSGELECFSVVFGAREVGCCREIAAQFCDLHRQLMLYLWDGTPFRCLDSHTVAQHSHLAWRGKRVTPTLPQPPSLPSSSSSPSHSPSHRTHHQGFGSTPTCSSYSLGFGFGERGGTGRGASSSTLPCDDCMDGHKPLESWHAVRGDITINSKSSDVTHKWDMTLKPVQL